MLGDAQLLYPGRPGRLPVALDVLGGEVALGRGVGLVRAQVEVVVGEHRPRAYRRRPGRGYAADHGPPADRRPRPRVRARLDLLEAIPSVSNLIFLAGAARKPAATSILCDVAREDASVVIDDLRELDIPSDGSISLEAIDSQISDAADGRAGRRGLARRRGRLGGGRGRTSENIELDANFLAFMVLACLIAWVGDPARLSRS